MQHRVITAAVLTAAGFALAGCGGQSTTPAAATPASVAAPTTSASPTPSPGTEAFMADLRANRFGTKTVTDEATWTRVANNTCMGLSDGVSFGQQVQVYTESEAKPTRQQAEAFIRSAVRNFCPEPATRLP